MLPKTFLFLLLLVVILPCHQTQAEDRPNILFAFADDWGRYASAYAKIDGEGTVNDAFETPAFDRIANEGVLFRSAFVTAPSCTPCRSSLLSGQYFFRTGRAAILQGAKWEDKIPTYPLLLRDAGYHIGHTYKVWSPGSPKNAPYGAEKYAYNKRGSKFNRFSQGVTAMMAKGKSLEDAKNVFFEEAIGNFDDFLNACPSDQPFCYWFGPTNVHRKWTAGSGKKLWGIDPDDLEGKLPPFLPDVPVVRQDFADYLGEAKAFDTALGLMIEKLEELGQLDNTLVIVSGDHGAPGFPRGKCNLYDFGVSVPLAVRWPGKIKPGRVFDDLVNLMDLAPTFLDAGGVEIPDVMTGTSLMPILQSEKSGQVDPNRKMVITGRERHVANARAGNSPYPHRAIRTPDFLYIRNFRPDRFPMGDPKVVTDTDMPSMDKLTNNTFIAYGDLDASPTKAYQIKNRHSEPSLFALGYGKRPEEELYDLKNDKDQICNVAYWSRYEDAKKTLSDQLMSELKRLGDPRVEGQGEHFERPPFSGVDPGWK